MHVPDGFFDTPTSVATGVVAVGAVAVSLRQARNELDERTAPMAGLVAAFIFATQMLNFPVGAGTSGHLLGGALAAVLVGPWTAVLGLSAVVLVQALLCADGGVSALGTNIVVLGGVTVAVGWGVFKLVTALLPKTHASVVAGAFFAALISGPSAAIAFVALFEVGGNADVSLSALLGAMVGWHLLIGLGEAIITALTVSSVLAVRPDLVYGARGLITPQPLEIRTPNKQEAAS
jgi:cobalt/nickel transport system permease protein